MRLSKIIDRVVAGEKITEGELCRLERRRNKIASELMAIDAIMPGLYERCPGDHGSLLGDGACLQCSPRWGRLPAADRVVRGEFGPTRGGK